MKRESREIVQNYLVAMRHEMNALNNWAMGLTYFQTHLSKLESLARNCREKITVNEDQLRMEV